MGNYCSQEQRVDRLIANKQRKDERILSHRLRLLFLGPGESGKSAVFKQLKSIHGQDPSVAEMEQFRQIIHQNAIEAVRALCEGCVSMGLQDQVKCQDELKGFLEVPESGFQWLSQPLGKQTVGAAARALWADEAIQSVWKRRSEIQIVDSHEVFLNDLARLEDPKYQPTVADSILARVRTTGVNIAKFEIAGARFELYDVGGQRNERKKWIHVFDDVQAVIFVAALSEYDQRMFEDAEQNRMVEALQLFEWIAKHERFVNIPVILFLNKKDLFQSKLSAFPIQSVPNWSDYDGGADFDKGVEYFQNKFLEAAGADKAMYMHATCATDPDNVSVVFDSCRDIVMSARTSAYL